MHDPTRTLVGRTAELRTLEAAFRRAEGGQGSVVLLVGEAGIGKTRLVDELAAVAERGGATVVFGRAWEAGGAPAYFPWIQLLRALSGALGRARFESLAGTGLPALSALLADEEGGAPRSSDPASARFRLFDAVTEVLRRAAEERPLVAALDDLHAADPSSLSLLHFVSRNLRASRILLVGTRRDEDARLTDESRDVLARVAREGSVLPLRRLSEENVAELVEARLPGTRGAISRIVTATEGNPLFVVEFLRLAEESGGTLGSAALPESVMDALKGRLALLDDDARGTLAVASVLGRDFDIQSVAALAERTPGEIAGSLATAIRARVLSDEGDGRRRFSHILFREAVYRPIPAQQKTALHRAAAALASSETERAHHLFAAVPLVSVEDAVRAAREAAARSIALYAFEDGVLLLERAAETFGAGTPKDRVELLLSLAEAQFLAGLGNRGRKTARDATRAARAIGDAELEARAALAHGSEFSPGIVDPDLVQALEEALARLPTAASGLRAKTLGRLAGALQPAPDPEVPMRMAREAIQMARETHDERTLLGVLHTAGSALADFADPAERSGFNTEAAALAEKFGERALALRAYARLVFDEIERGDFAASERAEERYAVIAHELRRPHHLWPLSLCRAMRAVQFGRWGAAVALANEAEEIARVADDPRASLCLFLHRFGVARARFDDDGIRASLATAPTFSGLPGMFEQYMNYVRAGGAARLGDVELARECLSRARLVGTTIETTWLAEAAIVAGDRPMAERFFRALSPLRPRFVSWGLAAMICEAPYSLYMAELGAFLGRPDTEALFTEAIALLRARHLSPSLARALTGYAAYLRARGEREDVRRAATLQAEARSLAESLGLEGLLARLGGVEPSAPPNAPSPSGTVTLVREGEYWTLSASGKTHRFKDSKGMAWLAVLLSRPGEEIHVLDLASPEGDAVIDTGDAGELLDKDAVAQYRRRLADLRTIAEEAESMNDVARARRAREEMEAIASELSAGTGLGGKERRAGSAVERARVNATRRIRDALHRIEEQLPELGRLLDAEIRTGVSCVYLPGSAPNRQKRK